MLDLSFFALCGIYKYSIFVTVERESSSEDLQHWMIKENPLRYHHDNKGGKVQYIMVKVMKNAEFASANDAKVVETLKGFGKIAEVGNIYTTVDGKEFKVLEIAKNLTNENGSRVGLQMSFEIDGITTGFKRLEALSKLLGLSWETNHREFTFESARFAIMDDAQLEEKAVELAERVAKYDAKISALEMAKSELIAKVGGSAELSSIRAFLIQTNEENKVKAAEAKAKADERKALKDATDGKTKNALASELLSRNAEIERMKALLRANGLDPEAMMA